MKQNKTISIFVIVLALAILSCSGAGGIPNLFATATATATNTFTPSPTLTPSPTATQTQTPSPTPLPTGVATEAQSDGSTIFTDYDNKYELILPKDWVAIPLSSKDLAQILKGLSEKNPALKDIAESFKRLDPNVMRVIAVNANPKYMSNGFSTNLSITAIEDKVLSSMPIDFVTGAVEELLKKQGAKLLSSGNLAIKNANGVEIGILDFQQTAPTASGSKVQVRSKAIVFQAGGKMIMVQLATPLQFGEELLPILDKVSDSITLMKP